VRYLAHFFAGAIIAAIIFFALGSNLVDAAAFGLVSGIASLLPDLDLRKSKASQVLYALAAVAALAGAYFISNWDLSKLALNFVIIILLLAAIDILFRPRHRTVFHTGGAAAALAVCCYILFGFNFALASLVGYGSHLVLDKI
jgi:hypothetical protein